MPRPKLHTDPIKIAFSPEILSRLRRVADNEQTTLANVVRTLVARSFEVSLHVAITDDSLDVPSHVLLNLQNR